MAAAIVTVTVGTTGWADSKYHHMLGLTISASPATYTAGGIACNLNSALIKASRTPSIVFVYGISGYIYAYIKGTDNSNGLLKIFAQTASAAEDAPLGELTDASAIPAGVSGDTILAYAIWKGME